MVIVEQAWQFKRLCCTDKKVGLERSRLLRQSARTGARVLCLPESDWLAPHSISLVLFPGRGRRAEPDRGAATCSVPALRYRGEWSGSARSDPGQARMAPVSLLGPAQGPEGGPQRRRRGDGQGLVASLAIWRGSWLGLPGCDRRIDGPDRGAAALSGPTMWSYAGTAILEGYAVRQGLHGRATMTQAVRRVIQAGQRA